MLRDQPSFTAADMRYLQMDAASPAAGPIRDEFVRALLRMPNRPIELTRVMNILAHWDLRMPASSVAAAIFNAAFVHACEETFADEMGPDRYRDYVFLSNVPLRVFPRLLADTAATWFDNVRTAGIETRDDILRKSVLMAMLDLTRRLGQDLNRWTWGALHHVTFRHPLGRRAPLDRLFDVGPFAIGGASTTVASGEYAIADPYDCIVGPTLRMVADMGCDDTLLVVLPTGQSGQPFSPHYADMAPRWLNGAYHHLIINPALFRRDRWERLELAPR
jgi:penicillin amidase